MKLLFLWTHLSGYLVANLNAAVESGHEVHLFHFGDHEETPFGDSLDLDRLNPINSERMHWRKIRKFIRELSPDLVVVCGWHISNYRKALYLNPAIVVFYMDNQWRGTFKQKIAVLIRNFLVKPFFDFAFLPGERQRKYALKLGFSDDRIWLRALNADGRIFKENQNAGRIDTFLYVGRLSQEKGILSLLKAYEEYRSDTPGAWNLIVIGDGPLRKMVSETKGVIWHGFLNQQELAALYQKPSVFVMPSYRDAWGVAMHEAALTGHPIIATRSCGASDAFVRENFNGYLMDSGNHHQFVEILRRVSKLDQAVLNEFSQVSIELAANYNSRIWVESLIQINESKIAKEIRAKRKNSILTKLDTFFFKGKVSI